MKFGRISSLQIFGGIICINQIISGTKKKGNLIWKKMHRLRALNRKRRRSKGWLIWSQSCYKACKELLISRIVLKESSMKKESDKRRSYNDLTLTNWTISKTLVPKCNLKHQWEAARAQRTLGQPRRWVSLQKFVRVTTLARKSCQRPSCTQRLRQRILHRFQNCLMESMKAKVSTHSEKSTNKHKEK
jgi:hypothetical protein